MNKLLLKDWYVICRKDEIEENKILLKHVFDQEIIIWKKKERIMAWENLCIHRGSRLSLGSINNGILKCAYHGWEYNQDAQCVKIPSQPDIKIPKKACVKSYKIIEKMNMVWINLSKEYDLFLNTTNFDNHPVSLIEAMALGLPIVSTNAGGIPNMLVHNKTAKLVETNDVFSMVSQINEYLSNSKQRIKISINARKNVESNFDKSKVLQQWIKVLNENMKVDN